MTQFDTYAFNFVPDAGVCATAPKASAFDRQISQTRCHAVRRIVIWSVCHEGITRSPQCCSASQINYYDNRYGGKAQRQNCSHPTRFAPRNKWQILVKRIGTPTGASPVLTRRNQEARSNSFLASFAWRSASTAFRRYCSWLPAMRHSDTAHYRLESSSETSVIGPVLEDSICFTDLLFRSQCDPVFFR